MDLSEEVDFDFFDTPRNEVSETHSTQSSKPPKPKRVTDEKISPRHEHERRKEENSRVHNRQEKSPYDSLSSDDSSFSDTDSETPRIKRAPAVTEVGISNGSSSKKNRGKMMPDSPESSSAYSDSDSYSDDSAFSDKGQNGVPKKNISVTLPKTAEAWGDKKDTQKNWRDEKRSKSPSEAIKFKGDYRERRMSANSADDSDSKLDKYDNRNRSSNSKHDRRDTNGKTRKPLRSTSSSHSNNSDITDVSPLESPEISPRGSRKRYDKVQYESKYFSEPSADIHMDSDKIDLSILMKCMADIDREKQQRIKANTRRVMFAPPSQHDKQKSNYSFSPNRARLIEKENQRLLQQIMQHVQQPGSKKLKAGTATRLAPRKATEPIVQRLTPSALNRQREQRKIEMENLQMLKRLQTVKATRGMSREEQLTEFDKHTGYGLPTCIMPASHHDKTMSYRETPSHMSGTMSAGPTQRSRPSSAKSNVSTGSRRSRPSSAKSNASIRSNASVRSVRSNMSIRSGTSTRRDKDTRPPWDDRFSYS